MRKLKSACLFLFGLALSTSFAAPIAVTSAVGQVGKELVTSRKVQISNFYDRWSLLPADKRQVIAEADFLSWQVTLGSEEYQAQISSLLLEWMVSAEAVSLDTQGKPEAELQAEAEAFVQSLKGNVSFKAMEVEVAEVKRIIRIKDLSQKFLKIKLEAVDSKISEAQARQYYQAQKQNLAGVPFESIKPMILQRLAQESQMSRLKDWFEILKRKYRVQSFGNPQK